MFKTFKTQMQQQFASMVKQNSVLFITDVDKQLMWDTYLNNFSEEERQGHNCNCCRQFIKTYGHIISIAPDNTINTIWDFMSNGEFHDVQQALQNLVVNSKIKEVFVTDTAKLGVDKNNVLVDDVVKTWEHLFFELPKSLVTQSVLSREATMATYRDAKNVLKRSLDELTIDSVNTVLELIAQNSIYRGEESKGLLESFLVIQKEYELIPQHLKDAYTWRTSVQSSGAINKIRNSAIGTLLEDVSLGIELDVAVGKFERMMAPSNYKRPTALITKSMITEAEKTITELGLTESLGRRFATSDDVDVNDVLFVNRDTKKKLGGIFDELKESLPVNPKSFGKVEEIPVKDFIEKILPKASNIELFVENQHVSNFVSLIAPKDTDAPSLFKWDNGFSWSYQNALADSMKERVKAAGGKIDGVLRFSIQWNDKGNNSIDFDAYAKEPGGATIYFFNNRKPDKSSMSGQLDVDIQNPGNAVAIENIVWSDQSKMKPGVYQFWVNNFSSRTSNGGFSAEIEFNGEVYSFEYPKNLIGKQNIPVAEVTYSGQMFTIKPLLESSSFVSSKKVWGIDTSKFHPVNMITKSPNHWGDQKVGNEHLFFMLDSVKSEGETRGFFNEFLKDDLLKNKRVFEALGGKLKVEPSNQQLSGLGFSSTMKNEVVVKVEGSFSRIVKIKF